jgi:hypothetical protein
MVAIVKSIMGASYIVARSNLNGISSYQLRASGNKAAGIAHGILE